MIERKPIQIMTRAVLKIQRDQHLIRGLSSISNHPSLHTMKGVKSRVLNPLNRFDKDASSQPHPDREDKASVGCHTATNIH